jgi:hypothetical protein
MYGKIEVTSRNRFIPTISDGDRSFSVEIDLLDHGTARNSLKDAFFSCDQRIQGAFGLNLKPGTLAQVRKTAPRRAWNL